MIYTHLGVHLVLCHQYICNNGDLLMYFSYSSSVTDVSLSELMSAPSVTLAQHSNLFLNFLLAKNSHNLSAFLLWLGEPKIPEPSGSGELDYSALSSAELPADGAWWSADDIFAKVKNLLM